MKRIIAYFAGLLLLAWVIPALAQTPAPAASDVTVNANVQRFENGVMIWRSDTSFVWVLADDSLAFGFPAASYATLPDNPVHGSPPDRLRPIFGFGQIWGNNADVRALLGWPTLPEIGFSLRIVFVDGTFYLRLKDGSIDKINPDGTWVKAPALPIVAPVVPTQPPLPGVAGATITAFDVLPRNANPGDTIHVTWHVTGARQAILEVFELGTGFPINVRSRLAPVGSASVMIPPTTTGDVRVTLIGAGRPGRPASNDEPLVQTDIVVHVLSATPDQTVHVGAAFQPYQNGFMIWRGDTGDIFVFFGSGRGSYALYPGSVTGTLPDNPLAGQPAGLVRPINGFGRVWGNTESVRTALGWAIAPEQGYQATVTLAQGTPLSITRLDGALLSLTSAGAWSTP